jgi:hypothetical protein
MGNAKMAVEPCRDEQIPRVSTRMRAHRHTFDPAARMCFSQRSVWADTSKIKSIIVAQLPHTLVVAAATALCVVTLVSFATKVDSIVCGSHWP